MNYNKLVKHTKKYLKDFMDKFCKGTKCSECHMDKNSCIQKDIVKIVCKAVDLSNERKK